MSPIDYTHILTKAVDELSDNQSYRGLFHQHREGEPLPSGKSLERIVELSRAILFPGYFGNSTINSQTINYHIGVNIEELFSLLIEQIQAGLCFGVENSGQCDCQSPCRATATQLAAEFISRLPEIRRILATDVEAAYYGDPAATCFGEIICCYPVIRAVTNYRIAHELHRLNVPLIPRIITEMAHSETGIDIHPGAQIGHHFTIDHGTGVVIGDLHHRQSRETVPGCHIGCQEFPLRRTGKPHQGYSTPPDTGRQCDCLLQCHHFRTHHHR